MQRYFVEEDNNKIIGSNYHRITQVMRGKVGDKIVVCCNGVCNICTIDSIGEYIKYSKLKMLEKVDSLHITLIQGFPKGKKYEDVIKTSSHLGVSNIIFVKMQRSEADPKTIKDERAKLIIKEACELSRRDTLAYYSVSDTIERIDYSQFDLLIMADEEEKDNVVSSYLTSNNIYNRIGVIIGPEGGINSAERAFLKEKGAKSVTLGSLIFPTQLANIVILSIINEWFLNNVKNKIV
ncbi:MAG: RsmE family RNA methyltransferase [Acholeplasmatales bacterium]|jgi:16S rRNA (uracil1498-N3)-methyltransferase|nr:RsmE family RNA methyltransferase [Acholeplasmatales bacterium]